LPASVRSALTPWHFLFHRVGKRCIIHKKLFRLREADLKKTGRTFMILGGFIMGNKNIRKEEKKKKKTDAKPVASSAVKPAVVQPEVIKKAKKES